MIVNWDALVFFEGSGNCVPFSVDMFDFCRSLSVENKTTIKIYKSHDVLLTNEVHNVIKRKVFVEIRLQFDIILASGRK